MSDIPADYDGRTGLHLSAAEGHVACAALLLDHGADLNFVDRFGRTGAIPSALPILLFNHHSCDDSSIVH